MRRVTAVLLVLGVLAGGTLGRVTAFSETEDGRYMITLSGQCRFRVREEVEATMNRERCGILCCTSTLVLIIDIGDVDAVVLLAGVDYNHDMDDLGEAALVAFVGAGGGLLTTEWLAFSASARNTIGGMPTPPPISSAQATGPSASGSSKPNLSNINPPMPVIPKATAICRP